MPTILGAIANRHSTRKFQPRSVDREYVEAMLEAARLSPAACNLSHVRVIVVQEEDGLDVVRRAAYDTGAVASAPLVLVLMVDLSVDEPFRQQMEAMLKAPGAGFDQMRSGAGRPFELKVGRDWAFVNAGIAGEHMMLQAVEMGLAGCWVHHFDHDEVRAHFKLPEHLEMVSLMAFGHPDETPPPSAGRMNLQYQVPHGPAD